MNMLRGTSLLTLALMLLAFAAGCATLSNDSARLTGYQHYRNGDFDDAREEFMTILDRDPTDWRSHYYVGMIAMNHDDDPTLAKRHFDIAYTIHQGRATQRLNYEIGDPKTGVPYPTRADILDAAAEALHRQEREQALFAFLQQAVDDRGTVYDHLRMGRYMRKVGDHDSARSAYRAAARRAGASDPGPYLELAEFYDSIGDQELAVVQYRKAYTIDPENREAIRGLRAAGITPGPTIYLQHDAEVE